MEFEIKLTANKFAYALPPCLKALALHGERSLVSKKDVLPKITNMKMLDGIKQSNFARQVHQLFEVHKIIDVVGTINLYPPFFMQLFHNFGGFFNTDFCHLC